MLSDPVDGFLSGLSTGPARLFVGLVAVALGFTVCIATRGDSLLLAITLGPMLTIFGWADYGLWFLVGLCSLVGIFAFLHAFVMERAPGMTLFATFTCAAIYLSPMTFDDPYPSWRWTLLWYVLGAAAYWLLPSAIARALAWKEERARQESGE